MKTRIQEREYRREKKKTTTIVGRSFAPLRMTGKGARRREFHHEGHEGSVR
jgi:hypothetical protein